RGSLEYELASAAYTLQLQARGARVGPLAAILGQSGLEGLLYGEVSVEGGPRAAARGRGGLELVSASLPGFSLLQPEGRGGAEEAPRLVRMAGDFDLSGHEIRFEGLEVEQGDASAMLAGDLDLRAAALDLAGNAELPGTAGGRGEGMTDLRIS